MLTRILTLLLSAIILACGSPSRKGPNSPLPANEASIPVNQDAQPASVSLDGKALYDELCAACHQVIEQTSIPRASLTAIQTALAKIPEMQTIRSLTSAQLEAISLALSKAPPGKAKGKP